MQMSIYFHNFKKIIEAAFKIKIAGMNYNASIMRKDIAPISIILA